MKRNITALSFTPKYDPLEDRIRVSINYDDFTNRVDLMFTRAFILKLFPILDDYMSKFYDAHIEVEKTPQENMQKMVDEEQQTSVTDGTNLELYKQEDELVIEVKFSFVKDTKMSIVVFESKETQVSSHLDLHAMKQIFTVIKASIPFFAWGISHNL